MPAAASPAFSSVLWVAWTRISPRFPPACGWLYPASTLGPRGSALEKDRSERPRMSPDLSKPSAFPAYPAPPAADPAFCVAIPPLPLEPITSRTVQVLIDESTQAALHAPKKRL